MGAVGDGARGVLLLFGISIIVTALLIWYYAGRWNCASPTPTVGPKGTKPKC